jgi:putative ABC transport system permease protein
VVTFRELLVRLWGMLRPGRTDRDLEEELRLHADLAAEDADRRRRTSNLSTPDAPVRAGGIPQAMEALRDQRGLPWLTGLSRDLRLAVRTLRHRPAFSSVAILTLALGIAANAVVFGVVKTVLLTPLPYGTPDRLVTVVELDSHTPNADTVSVATVHDWLERGQSFDHLSVFGDFGVRPIVGSRVEELRGMRVSGDFFETLGVQMYIGRSFRPEDDAPSGGSVLILTYGAWVDVFGGDLSVVGRSIPTIDGTYQVVGVLPPDFHPLHMSNPAELPRVFMPLGYEASGTPCRAASCRGLRAIGRLRPGVSSRAAEAELQTIMRSLVREYPVEYAQDASARVTPLRDRLIGHFAPALWLLQAAVLLLLALACANVATLLLARTIPRQREMAVRAALGAGRWQMIRQLLTESAVLAGTGGAVGVSLAWAVTRFIARTATTNIPRIGELAPDKTMLLFGVVVSATTTIVFGLLPAVLQSRGSPATLRMNQSATGHRAHHRLVHGLIACELALAFVLVLSVGLLGKSYWRVMRVDPGFDAQNVLTLTLLPDGMHYGSQTRRLAYFDAVAERMRTIPGVQETGYASTLPLSHPSTARVYIREHPLAKATDAPNLDAYLVSATYLDVMRIPVTRGRGFTAQDGPAAEPVAIVSESAARILFRGEDPIGEHVQLGRWSEPNQAWAVVVGVVGDVHQYGLEQKPDAAVYLPFAQVPLAQGWASLVVRSIVPPERIESAVRATMIAVDPLQPIFHLQPMGTYIALSVAQRTFTLVLIAAFGVLALALATSGVYGVVSYVVEQRTREVGLRLALGATPVGVSWMIVRQILLIAVVGITVGLAISTACTRALSTLLFGVSPLDGGAIVGVLVILVIALLTASAVPVLRAARIAPANALRSD